MYIIGNYYNMFLLTQKTGTVITCLFFVKAAPPPVFQAGLYCSTYDLHTTAMPAR